MWLLWNLYLIYLVAYSYVQVLVILVNFFNKLFKIHHPGSKKQLEEVWEKQDEMEGEEFNPKAFFALHGLYKKFN